MFVGCLAALGQIITPLTWKSTLTMQNETEGVIKLKAHVEDGWHFYALQMPDDGPMATQFGFDKLEGVELVGDITPSQAPKEEFDNVFNLNLGWWGSDVTFSQKFKITSSSGLSGNGKEVINGINDRCQQNNGAGGSKRKLSSDAGSY